MKGENKGRIWPSEKQTFVDGVSGATVHQLTSYMAHNYHPYFTDSGWYDEGRKLVFISERENSYNIYSVDLFSGEILQLTDLDLADGELGNRISVNTKTRDVYYYQGPMLRKLDLDTLQETDIYRRPDGYMKGSTSTTADGKYVITFHIEDVSGRSDDPGFQRFAIGKKGGDVSGYRQMIWELHPHSTIVKVAVDGSGSQVVHEEDYYFGHANPSPTLPNIMTFCHEGNWNVVENRIWGLDINTGDCWAIRENAPDEAIGHEYWMHDGEHIGFHGRTPNGPVYGSIRYDNTEHVEAPFTYGSTHFHSLSLDTIVGDGSAKDTYLLMWKFRGDSFEGPRVLTWHRGSFHVGRVHAHPCCSPYAPQVVYTSDPEGYGQIYLVDIPDWDDLPERTAL